MTIGDLIDLEAQLAADRDADAAALERRDRALLGGVRPDPSQRGRLLARWLQALRENDEGALHPGRKVERSLRWTRGILLLAGVVLGWGTASAVLQYTGGHPVNVWDFLLVFVGLQVALFVLLLASFVVPVSGVGVPVVGLLRTLVAVVYPRLTAHGLRGPAQVEEWRRLLHHLRSRRSLYRHVEPWLLLGLTQSFGVAFNVGALASCLRLVTFSDLAFSWSTTLVDLDPDRFRVLVQALAAPWGWAWPDAVPSRELVAATRYSRLEGAYLGTGAHGARPELAGGWWPFLVAALTCYGLLPRLLTLLLARLRTWRLLASLPLDDAEVSRVRDRLAGPFVETGGATPEPAGAGRPSPAAPASVQTITTPRCAVILWRDVPAGPTVEATLARYARCEIASVQAAGGRDHEEGGVDWRSVADDADGVLVVAEAWEAPDRGVLRLMRELRAALDRRLPVRVLLLDTSEGTLRPPPREQVQLWREGLGRLEDPYLGVEPFREAR